MAYNMWTGIVRSVQWVATSWMNKVHFPAQTDFSAEQLWSPHIIIAVRYYGFLSPRVRPRWSWNLRAVQRRDFYFRAAFTYWWHGVSSEEELSVWFHMKVMLCICILISVKKKLILTRQYFWLSAGTVLSLKGLKQYWGYEEPIRFTTSHLVRNMANLWYRISNLSFSCNFKVKIRTC